QNERLQHGFVEEEMPHPLGNQHIRLRVGGKRLVVGVMEADLGLSARRRYLARVAYEGGSFDSIDLPCPMTRGEDGQDTRARPKVDDSTTGCDATPQGFVVRRGAHDVLEHDLVGGGIE